MAIKNITEQIIVSVIEGRKSERSAAAGFCWCPVCEADVMAHALSSVPPSYCTVFKCDESAPEQDREMIEEAVEEAERRVANHPQHGRGDTLPIGSRLVNFNRKEGDLMLDALAEASAIPCSCGTCRDDMLALALNRCPPRYGVERNGCLDYPASEKDKVRQQVGIMLAMASGVVAGRLRHQ